MSRPNEDGISAATSVLTVKNVPLTQNIALIFKMEFSAQIPTNNSGGTTLAFFTLGWTIHMPEFNMGGELKEDNLNIDFTMGPGTSVLGDFLWNADNEDVGDLYQVTMTGLLTGKSQVDASQL